MDRSMLRSFAVAGLLTFFSTLAAAEEAPSNQAISGERDFNRIAQAAMAKAATVMDPRLLASRSARRT